MVAAGGLYVSPGSTLRRAQGSGHVSDNVWTLLILLSTTSKALTLFARPSTSAPAPRVDKFFYNGTYASPVCLRKFTCETRDTDVPECSCHPQCSLFDECCEDVRPTNWSRLMLQPEMYECTPALTVDDSASQLLFLPQLSYFYVITKCPSAFNGPLIREYCEERSNYTLDGTQPALVTDNTTGLTFANMFCAYCNGVHLSHTVSWTVQEVCTDDASIGLFGCKQRWIKPNNTADLADCMGSYKRSCPGNASSLMQAACTDNPVKRIYDSEADIVYRNYNCALCYPITDPSWSCSGIDQGHAEPIEGSLRALLVNYKCPERLTTFATIDERMLWAASCPTTVFDANSCSDTMTPAALGVIFETMPTDEYYFTPEGVRVVYNSSYAACARCTLFNYTDELNNSWHFSSTRKNITVDRSTYSLPFFKVVDGNYVTVCSQETFDLPTTKCTDLPSEVSQVLMSLSLLGLTLYAVAYGMLQSLQNLPGQIVLHQSAAFFAAFLIFMLRVPAGIASDGACIAVGVLSHFFFLAAFTWTAVYATEVVRALGLQAYGSGFSNRRIRYVIIGWLLPAIVMVAAIATNWGTSVNLFRPAYGRPQCFINSQYGHRIFFTAPLALCLLIDVVVYVYVIAKLVVIRSETRMVRDDHHEKLFISVKLVFAMGITWIFAVLASATGECILEDIFQLLNSLQGVFIFIIFVCNAKTLGQLRKKVKAREYFRRLSHFEPAKPKFLGKLSMSFGRRTVPERKAVLDVHSFSPVSLTTDAHSNEREPSPMCS